MTFRARVLLACLIVAVAPLALFVLGARRVVSHRIEEQFEARVAAAAAVIRQDIARQAASIERRLRGIAQQIDREPEQRAALLERSTLLDLAAQVMPATGLDYLLLLDAAGNVLSSGHFRHDFDRPMAAAGVLAADTGVVLVAARRAEGSFLALARALPFRIGADRFVLVGGIEVDATFLRALARDAGETLIVQLDHPGGALSSSVAVAGRTALHEQIEVRFADDTGAGTAPGEAHFTIAHSLATLHAVRRGMDRWFVAALASALVLGFVMARILARRVSRPLEELAQRASRVDLDRPDVDFTTRRSDEIGTLSRMLDGMVHRLRASAHELRAAERRATVGDMARQVNHDIRNGLLPIRNVIRHLAEVAHDTPAELGTVFRERASTLHSGIAYLDSLATNYARLSPRTERQICDVNAIVRAVAHNAAEQPMRLELAERPLRVAADPVSLRRVVENLTVNAMESLDNGTGTVTITTAASSTATGGNVTISVADTGVGIGPDAVDHVFDDFFTTKERGTGLGLSIVRRLVADMGGRIQVESVQGRGTTFRIELPEAT